MENKLTLFILDDDIPKTPEFVESSIYDTKISSKSLSQLIKNADWKGQHNLEHLTSDLLASDSVKSGLIEIYGFTHPAICLDEIDRGLLPHIIVFDWEYGSQIKETPKWLLEILNSTEAFIFVYSAVRNAIPPFLNKSEFDPFSSRFQLFLKGDAESSVFSSEEFILQYILSRVSRTNRIKVHGIDISFTENGYLENPSDILHLEKILGRVVLVEKFSAPGFSMTKEGVEELMEGVGEQFLLDSKRGLLITSDSTLLIEKFKPESKLSYVDALKKYGLLKIKEALEAGLAKV